ncbi:MAG: hypothetical protein FWD22_07020, partial [Treponema sp.]|nr:hypothetical protein [Treponema sp.]
MNKIRYTAIALLIISLLFFSCDLDRDKFELKGNFWAKDFLKDNDYRVDAELLFQNSLCEVWVEKGSGVTVSQAEQIA